MSTDKGPITAEMVEPILRKSGNTMLLARLERLQNGDPDEHLIEMRQQQAEYVAAALNSAVAPILAAEREAAKREMREACAKVCEEIASDFRREGFDVRAADWESCAEIIRALPIS